MPHLKFPCAAAYPLVADRLVYLVHANGLVAGDIAAQLRHFGYRVVCMADATCLEQAVAQCLPAAVVIDAGTTVPIFQVADEIARINAGCARRFAVVFLSAQGSFGMRLAAARADAGGYFANPLNLLALVERLDALTAREEVQPYRVLVINSDKGAADSQGAMLTDAGMEVTVLRKLTDMLQVLRTCTPDIVLMDVQHPMYDGADLAKLIRQDDSCLDVPIVLLADEAGVTKHLDAIASGADDFLAKPIQPLNLVSLLSSRARRYRSLRSLIMRDGLTGLLNHSALKEQIDRETARARRTGEPLALAMIDIDFFKRINDSYGHPVGDKVIRTLARLLQQRMRRGDAVGRYGGEEFGVVMPSTPLAAAAAVIDSVREGFAEIRLHAEGNEFSATFSAGVAALDCEFGADELVGAADAALYAAKHNGRNRVEVGSSRDSCAFDRRASASKATR